MEKNLENSYVIPKWNLLGNITRALVYHIGANVSRIVSVPAAFVAWASSEQLTSAKIIDWLAYGADIPWFIKIANEKIHVILDIAPILAKDPSLLTLNQIKQVVDIFIPNFRPIFTTLWNLASENALQTWVSSISVFVFYSIILPLLLKYEVFKDRATFEHKVRIRLSQKK